jgi:probable rRNA maturation factor
MTAEITLQRIYDTPTTPTDHQLTLWAQQALIKAPPITGNPVNPVHLTIRLVDKDEMVSLNQAYRQKNTATNVLSFPFSPPVGIPSHLLEEHTLGDIVICAPTIQREALEQGKPEMAHWAHMVIHGVLHLLGYDHIDDLEADVMENVEIDILRHCGISNPYHPLQPPSSFTTT